jgi:hypothetical protein
LDNPFEAEGYAVDFEGDLDAKADGRGNRFENPGAATIQAEVKDAALKGEAVGDEQEGGKLIEVEAGRRATVGWGSGRAVLRVRKFSGLIA